MSSPPVETSSAEARFRDAFERLKACNPKVLERGSPVSQNNVAREAGCDPSALKKIRFPTLVREIQAYLELQNNSSVFTAQKTLKQMAAKRSLKQRLEDTIKQRDQAQSLLLSANMRIVELSEQVQSLQLEIDEFRPPPKIMGRR